jgi:hypothetical protein
LLFDAASALGLADDDLDLGREHGDAVVAVETPFGMDLRQQSFPTDPSMLKEIAESSGGAFYRAENKAELDRDLGGANA